MQKLSYRLALSTLVFSSFSLITFTSDALVPGPILLKEKTVAAMQQDEQRTLKTSTQRARNNCLSLDTSRVCIGYPKTRVEKYAQSIDSVTKKRTLFYYNHKRLTGMLSLLPAKVSIPRVHQDAVVMGKELMTIDAFKAQFDGVFIPQDPQKYVSFTKAQLPKDTLLYYNAKHRLGALVHSSEKGAFVIGVLVNK